MLFIAHLRASLPGVTRDPSGISALVDQPGLLQAGQGQIKELIPDKVKLRGQGRTGAQNKLRVYSLRG